MNIAQIPSSTLRLGLAMALCAAWLYGVLQWVIHPNGAAASIIGLIGFALFGLAQWVAPLENRNIRITVRVFGTVVGVTALILAGWLLILLRNGL